MSKANILLVEDDAALLEGLRDILELAGFEIITARNGLEGLAALERAIPDLIISDIMMPRMDGYQFHDAVRAHSEWVNTPFIFLTARGDKADIRRGKLLGADDYLTKPFEEEDLLVAIRAKLKRRAQYHAAHTTEIADLKHTILTTLNHEFRTPLSHIAIYSEMLTESGPDLQSEEFKEFMRVIQAGSERLRKLVEDFITLVELQTGEMQQTFERRRLPLTDLTPLLQQLVDSYSDRAAAGAVTLTLHTPPSLPPILADREFLASAISRLLENALKFSKKTEGQVTVSAQAQTTQLQIQVRDTGIGIRAEELAELFNMFHQIDRAKLEQQGSGSGLAIARGIIAMHGGTLTVDSAYAVGSTFTIELPVFTGESF